MNNITKKLEIIRRSEDMVQLISLTAQVELLKWKLINKIEKVCSIYRNSDESLDDWEKKLNELEKVLQHPDLQAIWIDEKGLPQSTSPLYFLIFEINRCRRIIKEQRETKLKDI